MHRRLYLLGFGYLAICGAVVLRHRAGPLRGPEHSPVAASFGGSAGEWFSSIKPYCNSVEVELAQRQHPAPATLGRLPAAERAQAAAIVFGVGHPVADAGDDRSAGPIMELVLDYIPNHYMALYHAGMSEYALAQPARARKHLKAFLSYYHENDGWTQNARDVLARLR